jgi:hypothetical protein
MWKINYFNEIFSSIVFMIEMLSMSNWIFDSTVDWFNLIESFNLCRTVNCSISAMNLFAASQFINMSLNSRSSYLDSMIEIKMKSNDSLMKALVMFFEISRCLNVLFASNLMIKTNSTLLIESNDVKNSSFDSNSINLASSIIDEIKLRSSKYWIAFSSSESSIMSSKSAIYCFKRRSYSERILYSEWRSVKRFFESSRFFSKWLIDQQSCLSHTKHFFENRKIRNLSFDLFSFRNLSRRFEYSSRRS